MSHELRTPLTSILGFTSLAGEQPDLAPLTRTYVERVSGASRALLCTVNDILDFSKLEAGQVNIQPQPVSLAKLARATLDLFTPQAGAKDLALTLDGEAADLTLSVDPDRIRQILLNLVSNAVKFTQSGGVTLRTRYDGGTLRVEVIDTGAGIPSDKQDRLFQRFSQVDGASPAPTAARAWAWPSARAWWRQWAARSAPTASWIRAAASGSPSPRPWPKRRKPPWTARPRPSRPSSASGCWWRTITRPTVSWPGCSWPASGPRSPRPVTARRPWPWPPSNPSTSSSWTSACRASTAPALCGPSAPRRARMTPHLSWPSPPMPSTKASCWPRASRMSWPSLCSPAS
uniref:histidine kinase n=1 Tax=Phenylobacterium glaciei TaxID=2803784 RepID=A0A974S838_9CAUL|nr:hypothetical protein JKL49_25090 [Phenylobacterium glaciei]